MSHNRRFYPAVKPTENWLLGPTIAYPTTRYNDSRSYPEIHPSEIRLRGPITRDPTPWSNHRRSDSVVQPSQIRPRGPTIADPTPAIQPPTGEPLSTVRPVRRGATLYGPSRREGYRKGFSLLLRFPLVTMLTFCTIIRKQDHNKL